MDLQAFLLVLTLFQFDGKVSQEMSHIEVARCAGIDTGTDSSCGLGACLLKGRARAAEIWGEMPGTGFATICTDDKGASKQEGAPAGGGHPGLGFH